MKCGSNLSLFKRALDAPALEPVEIIRRYHELGFETLDLDGNVPQYPDSYLMAEDWERQIDEIGEAAARYGMVFSQLHLPFHKNACEELDPRFQTPGFKEKYRLCTERAYLAGERLGIPWAVAHVVTVQDNGFCRKDTFEYNHRYYDNYVEFGIRHGVGTAFENLCKINTPHQKHRYCGHQDDLIEFVDSYRDPMVGICWDFGHANVSGLDQVIALRQVGDRLKCVHVNDNLGVKDDHLIPFVGEIDWYAIAKVLAEIGYTGSLSMEPGGYVGRAPRAMQEHLAKSAYESCNYLRKLCEEARKN